MVTFPRRAFVLLASALLVAAGPGGDAPAILLDQPVRAVVIDGDTIQIGGRVLDLFGIDVPELGQDCSADGVVWTCGMAAAHDLRKRLALARGPLVCEPRGTGTTGTTLAQCIVDTHDLGALQVEAGLAVVLPDGPWAYRALEARAREARLGIWHSGFDAPGRWREYHRGPEAGCPIRAVRTRDGRGLYVTPFDDPAVLPADARTEGFWCSDDVVRAVGYRRPGETSVASPGAGEEPGSRR